MAFGDAAMAIATRATTPPASPPALTIAPIFACTISASYLPRVDDMMPFRHGRVS